MVTDRPCSIEAFVRDSERAHRCAVVAPLFRNAVVNSNNQEHARLFLVSLCDLLGTVKQVWQATHYLNDIGSGPADVVAFGGHTYASAHEAAIELAHWYVLLVWIQTDAEHVPSGWEDPRDAGFDPVVALSKAWPNLRSVFELEPVSDSSPITARIDKERAAVIELLKEEGAPEGSERTDDDGDKSTRQSDTKSDTPKKPEKKFQKANKRLGCWVRTVHKRIEEENRIHHKTSSNRGLC